MLCYNKIIINNLPEEDSLFLEDSLLTTDGNCYKTFHLLHPSSEITLLSTLQREKVSRTLTIDHFHTMI